MFKVTFAIGSTILAGSLFFQTFAVAQGDPRAASAIQQQRFDVEKLRREAMAKHEILRITFFPNTDSVTNFDKLYDIDEMVQVEFIPTAKSK